MNLSSLKLQNKQVEWWRGGAAKTNNTSEDYDDDDIVTYDYPNKSEAEV